MVDRAVTFAFRVAVVVFGSALLASFMVWLWSPSSEAELRRRRA